jgi:CysZ protein
MTLLLTLIPVLNFLAMPAAVIGATLMWVREAPDPEEVDDFCG